MQRLSTEYREALQKVKSTFLLRPDGHVVGGESMRVIEDVILEQVLRDRFRRRIWKI